MTTPLDYECPPKKRNASRSIFFVMAAIVLGLLVGNYVKATLQERDVSRRARASTPEIQHHPTLHPDRPALNGTVEMRAVHLTGENEPQIARCKDGDGPDEEYRCACLLALAVGTDLLDG